MHIIAVDWGKDVRKRAAYEAELPARAIRRLAISTHLADIVEYASSLTPPVVVGIDAAIGFPATSWSRLTTYRPNMSANFIDSLLSSSLPADFFYPVARPDKWSPERPFIRPPAGRWSLKAFVEASNHGLYRHVDHRLNGNPMFVMSGIPGSVGSGTWALWQELIALGSTSTFRVWPFHGPLDTLLKADIPVIAEIYPKACYGIALADSLPVPLLSIAKTRQGARHDALVRLRDAAWVADEQVTIEDLDAALENEDDFDALMSAAALMRIFLENVPPSGPDASVATVEGDILGAASITAGRRQVMDQGLKQSDGKRSDAKQSGSPRAVHNYLCPIPGCQYIFHNSRAGWDAHVTSLKRHQHWHPDVFDPNQRKLLFKGEFAHWF